MRGYFGIGVEQISKPYNVGNLFRSAHAFDASFVFTVDAKYERAKGARTDTSDALGQLPFYSFPDKDSMVLPKSCKLVGVELIEDSIALPSFQHPLHAAYILGPEKGSLSPEIVERCDHIVQIPTKFCLNVGIAGVLVMYDRLISRGRFADRPVHSGGPEETLAKHVHGGQFVRAKSNEKMAKYIDSPPLEEVKIARNDGR
ncbi:MAG: RNA methyltransferase [Alphaproteobacteria bacterium]|nr:RNA methyltransferase [Alphaproteobacteria bacterium]